MPAVTERREAEQQHGQSSTVYVPILRELVRERYSEGVTRIEFDIRDVRCVAAQLGLEIGNAADLIYRMRSRTRLPDDVLDLGFTVLRGGVGRGRYALEIGGEAVVRLPEHEVLDHNDQTPLPVAVRLSLDGPYAFNGRDRLERFDWRLTFDAGGQRMTARVISSGRNVFVELDGVTYEVGEERVARYVRQQQAQQRAGGDVEDLEDVRRLGIDLTEWFPQSDTEEDSEVAGVPTTRVGGRLDVSVAVRDVRRLLRRPEIRSQLGERVPEEAFEQFEQAVSDPRFVLEAGREDGKLRSLTGTMRVRQDGGAALVRMGVTLRDVDRPVRIAAPASGRPIEELARKLGLSERELAAAGG